MITLAHHPFTATEFNDLNYYDALCDDLLDMKKKIIAYLAEHALLTVDSIDITRDPEHGFLVHPYRTTTGASYTTIDPDIFDWEDVYGVHGYALGDITNTLEQLERFEEKCRNIGVEDITAFRQHLHTRARNSAKVIEQVLKNASIDASVGFSDTTPDNRLSSLHVTFSDNAGIFNLVASEELRSITITAEEIASDPELVMGGGEKPGFVQELLNDRAKLIAGYAKDRVRATEPQKPIRFDSMGNTSVPLGSLRGLVHRSSRRS